MSHTKKLVISVAQNAYLQYVYLQYDYTQNAYPQNANPQYVYPQNAYPQNANPQYAYPQNANPQYAYPQSHVPQRSIPQNSVLQFLPAIYALQNPVPQKSSPQCVVLQFLPRKLLIRKYIPRNTLSGESCPVKSCPAKYCPAKLKIWSKLVGTPCNSVVVDSSSNLQFLYFLERKNPQSRKKCTILKPLKRWLNLLFEKKIFNFLKKVGLEKIEKFEIGKNLDKIFNLQILHKTVVKNTWAPEQILQKEKFNL